MKLSVIVPCYNEEKTVDKFYRSISEVFLKAEYLREIIFVNDGSSDLTAEKLSALAQRDETVKVIEFSRNFGQTAAIVCGLKNCSGDCAVILDCDLQDPVELIPAMLAKREEGYDVVHARRIKRKGESFFKRATAKLYYKFLSSISNEPIPRDTGEFKLLDRRVIDQIVKLGEHDKYLRGLESWVGFKQGFVDFERKERIDGKTHYTMKKMVKLATNGVLSNSEFPLYLPLKLGIFSTFASIAAFITFAVLAALGNPLPLTAWLFPSIGLAFSLSCVFLGFTNAYVARIYREVQNRPEYIIAKTINLEEKEKNDRA